MICVGRETRCKWLHRASFRPWVIFIDICQYVPTQVPSLCSGCLPANKKMLLISWMTCTCSGCAEAVSVFFPVAFVKKPSQLNMYLLNGIFKKWKFYKCRFYDLKVIYIGIKLDFYLIDSISRRKASKSRSVFTSVLLCGTVDDSWLGWRIRRSRVLLEESVKWGNNQCREIINSFHQRQELGLISEGYLRGISKVPSNPKHPMMLF